MLTKPKAFKLLQHNQIGSSFDKGCSMKVKAIRDLAGGCLKGAGVGARRRSQLNGEGKLRLEVVESRRTVRIGSRSSVLMGELVRPVNSVTDIRRPRVCDPTDKGTLFGTSRLPVAQVALCASARRVITSVRLAIAGDNVKVRPDGKTGCERTLPSQPIYLCIHREARDLLSISAELHAVSTSRGGAAYQYRAIYRVLNSGPQTVRWVKTCYWVSHSFGRLGFAHLSDVLFCG